MFEFPLNCAFNYKQTAHVTYSISCWRTILKLVLLPPLCTPQNNPRKPTCVRTWCRERASGVAKSTELLHHKHHLVSTVISIIDSINNNWGSLFTINNTVFDLTKPLPLEYLYKKHKSNEICIQCTRSLKTCCIIILRPLFIRLFIHSLISWYYAVPVLSSPTIRNVVDPLFIKSAKRVWNWTICKTNIAFFRTIVFFNVA